MSSEEDQLRLKGLKKQESEEGRHEKDDVVSRGNALLAFDQDKSKDQEIQQLNRRIADLEAKFDRQTSLLEKLLEKMDVEKSPGKKKIKVDDSDSLASDEDEEESSSISRGRREEEKQLKKFFEKVSPKDCPKPEEFAIETGMSFLGFIGRFERYCGTKYSKGSKSDWTAELGRFLKGEIKDAYNAYGGAERPYTTMRRKLEKFYDSLRDQMESRKHVTFVEAVMNEGESIRVFALRLEQLFLNAYPNQDPETSPDLRRKFLTSIPPEIARGLERDLLLIKTVGRKAEVQWSELVALLEFDSASWKTKPEKHDIWYGVQQAEKKQQVEKERGAASKPVTKEKKSSPRRNKRNNGRCNWCGKPGHWYKECWGRLGLCLLCGSNQHQKVDCPKYSRRSSTPDRRRSASRGSQGHGQRSDRSTDRGSRRHSHYSDRSTDGQYYRSDRSRRKSRHHRRSQRQARKPSTSSSSSAGHSRKPRYSNKKKAGETSKVKHQEN